MNNEMLYKGLKYLVWGLAVFCSLKYLPKEPMKDQDAILISTIAVLSYIVVENLANMYSGNNPDTGSCPSVCTRKEGMVSIGSPETRPNSQSEVKSEAKPEAKPEEKSEEQNNYKPITNSGQIERVGSRQEDGVITNDMPYTDYNTLPIGLGLNTHDYEYGDSFLPPDKWYPVPPHPPVCVTEKRCPVCPVFTTGSPVDVKDWNQTLRLSAPDNINTTFIKEKLNSGR